jgi:adenosylcobinamide kinase/adenosylcobinamide-phosphate guanylyltransferase
MLIFITGGARSGKSRYAQTLARELGQRVLFVATATPSDADLRRRIERHRRERPKHWRTLENPKDLSKVFSKIDRRTEVLLLDCLTLYVAGSLMHGIPESRISAQVEKFCKNAAASPFTTLIVSNEVGSGLVPTTDLGNKFRDYLGRANLIAARHASEAYLMVSGIPIPLKGGRHGR